jgi:hypothetical protein
MTINQSGSSSLILYPWMWSSLLQNFITAPHTHKCFVVHMPQRLSPSQAYLSELAYLSWLRCRSWVRSRHAPLRLRWISPGSPRWVPTATAWRTGRIAWVRHLQLQLYLAQQKLRVASTTWIQFFFLIMRIILLPLISYT